MIPWLAVTTFALIAWVLLKKREIDRQIEQFRAVEAERLAREAAAPLGNVDRYWGLPVAHYNPPHKRPEWAEPS